MSIGALARTAHVHVETVRYYQRLGLMRTPVRPAGGIRRYDEEDLARLRFIRRAKELGFSLRDIRALLQLDAGDCDDARRIAGDKLAEIRRRLHDLAAMAAVLETMIQRCNEARTPACPIIDSLKSES